MAEENIDTAVRVAVLESEVSSFPNQGEEQRLQSPPVVWRCRRADVTTTVTQELEVAAESTNIEATFEEDTIGQRKLFLM